MDFELSLVLLGLPTDYIDWAHTVDTATLDHTLEQVLTISPQALPPTWTTMMAWRSSAMAGSQPNLAARSITGRIAPRRLAMPAT